VVAFEPSLREFSELVKNIALNKASNVLPLRMGLAEQNQVAQMCIADELMSGCNKLGSTPDKYGKYSQEQVFTASFDSLQLVKFFGAEKRVYVKIDTEGYEMGVLLGMQQLLTEVDVRQIVVELDGVLLSRFGYSSNDVASFLKNKGFECDREVPESHGDFTFRRMKIKPAE
jgi:FkbM family methyltransferase